MTRARVVVGAVLAVLLALTGCAAPTGEERARMRELPPPGSAVAFYGDSLTAGFAASSPSARWTAILCERHGWMEVNPSISGLGFVYGRAGRDLPGQIIAARPDVILVTLGINDLRLVDTRGSEIEAAIFADLLRLRGEVPDADIRVAMPFSPISFRPQQLVLLEGWLRAAAADIDAEVIDSSTWMVGRTNLTTDGIHFNDAGERHIAMLMDRALRSR